MKNTAKTVKVDFPIQTKNTHRKQGHRQPYTKVMIERLISLADRKEGLSMIKGSFKRTGSGRIVSFELTGHAEVGPYGNMWFARQFLP